MTKLNDIDIDESVPPIDLVGHIKTILIREKTDSEVKFAFPKNQLHAIRTLAQHTETILQVTITVSRDHA